MGKLNYVGIMSTLSVHLISYLPPNIIHTTLKYQNNASYNSLECNLIKLAFSLKLLLSYIISTKLEE